MSTNDSLISDKSEIVSDDTHYNSEEEAFSEPIPANLYPIQGQTISPGRPITLDVDSYHGHSNNIPLCLLFNARSIYNKRNNLNEILRQIGPDISIISETFERETKRLSSILNSEHFESISYYRKDRAPGGGCAIIFNQTRFNVSDLKIETPDGIECCWALLVPKVSNNSLKVKRIAVGSYYISPRSKYKQETIDHIIDTIHVLNSKYDNEVNFIVGGDFNRVNTTDILDSYGALNQIVTIPTRQSATLEIILTDLHTLFHPPTTLAPLQVDSDMSGKDSDHDIVVLAPVHNKDYHTERKKKKIFTRPLPASGVELFEKALISHPWNKVFENKSIDEKVEILHTFLRSNLDKYLPEKITHMSNFDKKWFCPQLKQIHRSMQREFYKHRKSQKYIRLRAKFRKLKRRNVQTFFSSFVSELKCSEPSKWYSMAKKIGAVDQSTYGKVQVQSLSGLNNSECAQKIANHFAAISNEYLPINTAQLPSYLPAQLPQQIDEYDVYVRLNKLKKTRSTLPIDIPDKLRQECSPHLAAPVTAIYNDCLNQGYYPTLWKQEWVTPAPKIINPKDISDLRKISCTSDYSKIFEGFIKE